MFRAKEVETEKFVYGWYSQKCNTITDEKGKVYSVIPGTLSMTAGNKDKHGKSIYSGDIVYGDWTMCSDDPVEGGSYQVVTWSELTTGFYPFVNYDSDCGVYFYPDSCEVIGNIWDTPELDGRLKREKRNNLLPVSPSGEKDT